MHSTKKEKIIKHELVEMLSFISGLFVASYAKEGHKLVVDQEFEVTSAHPLFDSMQQNEVFFQKVFEIGRRYKIMNPEKMRSTYGKLMFMMMDAMKPNLVDMSVYAPISCVHSFLEAKDGLELLEDENIGLATRCVVGLEGEATKEESQKRVRPVVFTSNFL
jgi:hypothetical protein